MKAVEKIYYIITFKHLSEIIHTSLTYQRKLLPRILSLRKCFKTYIKYKKALLKISFNIVTKCIA